MSERDSNSQNRRYSVFQTHLHTTCQALQILATSSGKIQNQLRRVSNNLLQACPGASDLAQLENFGNVRTELNTSTQSLTNLTHDIA